jgi:hypothetical protein
MTKQLLRSSNSPWLYILDFLSDSKNMLTLENFAKSRQAICKPAFFDISCYCFVLDEEFLCIDFSDTHIMMMQPS